MMKVIKQIKQKIRIISLRIANFQSMVLLSIIYFLITPIFSLITNLLESKLDTRWREWTNQSDELEELRKQW